MNRIFLVLALALTILGYSESDSAYYQLASVFLLACAAFICLYNGIVIRDFTRIELTLIAMSILSLVTSLARDSTYGLYYTLIFTAVIVFVYVIGRGMSMKEIVQCLLIAVAICSIFSVALNFADFTLALSNFTDSHGLFRFSPFNMHPNQVGMAFGGGCVAFGISSYYSREWYLKIILGSFSLLCCIIVFSASSRASLLAIGLTYFIFYSGILRKNPLKALLLTGVGSVVLILFVVLNFDAIYDYLSGMLEFDSANRGIDSGGSGRDQLWSYAFSYIADDLSRIFFGGGFRSSNYEDIGFYLESSYLTLLYENGVFMMMLFLLALFKTIDANKNPNELARIAKCIVVYLVIQSFFNRYLLAIGNFYSLGFLLILNKYALYSSEGQE